MIDLERDSLIAVADVPSVLPNRRNGRPLSLSSIYRWAVVGVRGSRLETLSIGGTQYTTLAALQTFADASSKRRSDKAPRVVSEPSGRDGGQ